MSDSKIKVAFLDRDGVINKEVNYLHRIEDFEYTEGCVAALRRLNQLGYKIIIVTNQAGIARGYYTEAQYQRLTQWYLDDLRAQGVEILDVFHCPHHPQGAVKELSIECQCRKPNPGMLLSAAEKYSIDLTNSLMVGDKLSDVHAGLQARVGRIFMVESGHLIDESCKNQFQVYKNINELSYSLIS